jgi:hypothetical protein
LAKRIIREMRCTTRHLSIDSLRVAPRAAAAPLSALAALACAVVTAGGLAPHRAFAQAEAARPCTEIESDSERLACYDRALRPARPAAAAPPATGAPPATAAPPPAAPVELGTARSVEPRSARTARAQAAAAPPAAPSAPGAAQAPDEAAEIVPIVIVRVREIPGRSDRSFTTDNGVVWIQTDSSNLRFPETPFDAQIKPGAMGSYFLVTKDRNRAIRVRRQN